MNVFIGSISGHTATLTPEESWHCFKVLRCKPGDEATVIDGKGGMHKGLLNFVSEKKCIVDIAESAFKQTRKYRLHLAIAPTKQIDRIEWMIEKAVEIGIDEISFIQCKNSERVNLKIERMNKIVESAVKQSLQAFIPKVNELQVFNKFIQSANAEQKLIAHCYVGNKKELKEITFQNKSTLVLIGPEGDFTTEEVEAATQTGFESLGLGSNRLRTETAGLYVCLAAGLISQK